MVIASWYVELAAEFVHRQLALGPVEELVTFEDLGIEPYQIGEDY